MLTIGSLFSGYEGLGMALADVFGQVQHAFVADVCKHAKTKDGRHIVGHHDPCRAPCSILAHRFPDTPNLGDVALIDWMPWRGRIDIATAGFPCTDVSIAGRRAGLKDGTRSGLWSEVVRMIREVQPRMVVLENVPGIFTAPAAGDVEPCAWCVGDDPASDLRALDAVLADLAALGFDAEWVTVPASGVGAPHKRERWFLLAWPAADSECEGWGAPWDAAPTETVGRRSPAVAGRAGLLPTPRATDGTKGGPGQRGSSGDLMLPSAVALLPTPARNDMGEGKTPEAWDTWTAAMQAKHGNGNGHGKSLATKWVDDTPPDYVPPHTLVGDDMESEPCPECWCIWDDHDADGFCMGACGGNKCNGRQFLREVPRRLLPTPTTEPLTGNGHARHLGGEIKPERWGEYAAAITRWEAAGGGGMTTTAPVVTRPKESA